jgi:hypothetical protein
MIARHVSLGPLLHEKTFNNAGLTAANRRKTGPNPQQRQWSNPEDRQNGRPHRRNRFHSFPAE